MRNEAELEDSELEESELEVIRPGTFVNFNGGPEKLPAMVIQVYISYRSRVQYLVAWWVGQVRYEQVVAENEICLIKKHDKSSQIQQIGFIAPEGGGPS